jgi:hypothetical protein
VDTWLSCIHQFLKFGWSQKAESRMAPLPIVKHFDVVKDLSPSFLSGVKMLSMNQFHLEGVEEAFRLGIILTIPLPAHTALNAGGFQ